MALSYDARIEDLFSRHQSVAKTGFTSSAYKPGLDAIRCFDAALGHPSLSFRSIHVAGTNGKGSVCSMIASALSFAGFRTGLYTSPHLVDFRERIKVISPPARDCTDVKPQDICCEMISKEAVSAFLDRFEGQMGGLTFFELTTGMAFWWFAVQKVDIAVIETGLGGRLDSTNVIVPEISVVTSIGLDHCDLLGDTRSQIAKEKAGIFKPGVPAVVGAWDDETGPIFEEMADITGSKLYFADRLGMDVSGYELDLKGPCQDMNLRTAVTALSLMGVPPIRQAFSSAGKLTMFRGRWEYLRNNVICDIAHNPPALKENFARLKSLHRPLVIVFGIMADKNLDTIAKYLPSDASYVLSAPLTPRALPSRDLFERLSFLRPELSMTVCDTVAEALAKALLVVPPEGLVYVGGSTYVVSEAILSID